MPRQRIVPEAAASVLLAAAPAFAGATARAAAPFTLAERIQCQAAIERVYAQHRVQGAAGALAEQVPDAVIRAKAEDAVRKSSALERVWGIAVTGADLQAEVRRMAEHSQAPDVLAELSAAVGGDARRAAECLARPLLADRIIRTAYVFDQRQHGTLEARARAELKGVASAKGLKATTGVYSEVEWQVGVAGERRQSAHVVDAATFEGRAGEVRRKLAGPDGSVEVGRVSALGEDETRFYVVAVLAFDDQRIRLATVEWRKRSFDDWWAASRGTFPAEARAVAAGFPAVPVPFPPLPRPRCRDNRWKPTMQFLDPRYHHTAVWTGSEMIVFGGSSSVGTTYGDGSRYDPVTDTWTLLPAAGAPSRREHHVAVWTGQEMIVWGSASDNSGGRYNPATDRWTPISTANAPTTRSDATAVWTGTEMIIWGGLHAGAMLNDGGRYNPATDTWTLLPPVGLAPRANHAAVWTGTDFIVWGGYNDFIGQVYGDGARYRPSTNSWTPVASLNAPDRRFYHTAVWTGTEMIVWGGLNDALDVSGGRYNPVTDTWTPTSMENAPSLRGGHAAVWTGTEMIIQGEANADPGGRYRPATDTWLTTNPVNSATNGEGLTGVWTGTEMIIWGGLGETPIFRSDGHRYNPATDQWRPTSTMNVPLARGMHAAVWTGSEMMVWGGYIWGGNTDTGGLYTPATDSWMPTSVVGAPSARGNAEVVWTGTEAIFWGGFPEVDPGVGTGGRYRPSTDSWTTVTVNNGPNERYGHSAIWTGSEMIVFGGVGADPPTMAKRYHPTTDTWTDATLMDAPGGRDSHVAVWTGSEMIIWGGFINDGITPTGGRYNPATDTWTPTNVGSSPRTRMWPVGVWTGSAMIVWGGHDWLTTEDLGDGARYNPSNDTWTPVSENGAPTPRVTQGVWTGRELVVWGGGNDSSGARYTPATNTWRPTSMINPPYWRCCGGWSKVWTGSQMIIWGSGLPTQKGNLYCAVPRIVP